MGLISAITGAVSSTMADQWKEYITCDAIDNRYLMVRGYKKTKGNNKGDDNVITNGSIITVADGQCMIIVDQGKVVDLCAVAGAYTFDMSTEPSIFSGNLGTSIVETFKTIGKRFTFGGDTPKDMRVYYINTREIMGNMYGTPNPVPFRVVDERAGIDIDISLRCHGQYSYRICDPVSFYTNVAGNVSGAYNRDQLDSQLKSELLTALQPAFGRISEMGIRYSSLTLHTTEIADALNAELSQKWGRNRGIEIVEFGVSSVTADPEDEKMLKEMQKTAAYTDPTRLAAYMGMGQTDAAKIAAGNTATGPAMAFMNMGMAQQAGGAGSNLADLMAVGMQQQAQQAAQQQAAQQQAAAANAWKCSCGATATGKFCPECGAKKPEAMMGWTCSCGAVNQGKFCAECGSKKPAGVPQYKCDKCGWTPEDPANPPKFCPECGDPFGDEDLV